jgi:hypothetical protein
MGWQYPNGADMSGYKYLVIKLGATSSDSHLNIYTENSIWSPCFSTSDFGSRRQVVVNLSTAKYTSDGDKKGQSLDTENIHIVAFWGTGSKSIKVDDMYLTNNSDFSPSGIASVTNVQCAQVDVYNLAGQLIRCHADRSRATQGLPAGIYVVEGRKVINK